MANHPDYNVGSFYNRLKSTKDYITYLKHLRAVQIEQREVHVCNILRMIIDDLEEAVIAKKLKK